MKFWHLIAVISILIACACGHDRDLVPDEQTAIESYLSGKEYTLQNGVYVFVANADRESYATDPMVDRGDSVYFMFESYTFDSKPGSMYYTNKESKISGDTIINTKYWSFTPVGVLLGKTGLMRGLNHGLPGCRQGDSVAMFITTDLAYDYMQTGVVPANTAIMMVLNITEVVKK